MHLWNCVIDFLEIMNECSKQITAITCDQSRQCNFAYIFDIDSVYFHSLAFPLISLILQVDLIIRQKLKLKRTSRWAGPLNDSADCIGPYSRNRSVFSEQYNSSCEGWTESPLGIKVSVPTSVKSLRGMTVRPQALQAGRFSSALIQQSIHCLKKHRNKENAT